MRRLLSALLIALVLAPVAFALDYTDVSKTYTDAPFPRADSAGISVLTNLAIVSGNPDGTFAPRRPLNRAEFLKIALGAAAQSPNPVPAWNPSIVHSPCFPDVPVSSWFEPFVCAAKQAKVVQGNPDGTFAPTRNVNYAEAVKILATIFGYQTTAQSRDAWYDPFIRAAAVHGTLIPSSLKPDSFLTRAEMSRLTAAFIADSKGELALYRGAEQGMTSSNSSSSVISSSSSSSTSSSSSSSSVSSSSSSSSSASSLPDFPARGHFLLVGQVSPPIAGGTFFANLEGQLIRGAKVILKAKVESIDTMFLIDGAGTVIGQLSLDVNDSTDKTWSMSLASSGAYLIPKGTQRVIGVTVRLKTKDLGGTSDQLVQVDHFSLTIEGQDSHQTQDSPSPTQVFPQHQTARARITNVKNALSDRESLPLGTSQLLGAFAFTGTVTSGATLQVTSLQFQLNKSSGVAVSNWQLSAPNNPIHVGCSINVSTSVINCDAIPVGLGTISGITTLQLYGDVALDQGVKDPYIQVTINQPGAIGTDGAIHWTDSAGNFNWTELSMPIAIGTLWK